MADEKLVTAEGIQEQKDLVEQLKNEMQALQSKVPEISKKMDSLSQQIESLKKQQSKSRIQFEEMVPVFTFDSEYEKYKKQIEIVQNDADIVELEEKLRLAELASPDGVNPEVDRIRNELDSKRQYKQRNLEWLKQQMDNHSKTVEMSQVERIIARYEKDNNEEDKAFLNSLSSYFDDLPNSMVNIEDDNYRQEVQKLQEKSQQLRKQMEESVLKEDEDAISEKLKEVNTKIVDFDLAPQQIISLSQKIRNYEIQKANLLAKQATLSDPNSFEFVDITNQIDAIASQLKPLNEQFQYFQSLRALHKDDLISERERLLHPTIIHAKSDSYLKLESEYNETLDKLNQLYQKNAEKALHSRGNRLERLKNERKSNEITSYFLSHSLNSNNISSDQYNEILEQIRSKNAELQQLNDSILTLSTPETIDTLKKRSESLENQIKQLKNGLSEINISTEKRTELSNKLQSKSKEKAEVDARITTMQSMMVKKNSIRLYRELRQRVEQARDDADFMYPEFRNEEKLLHDLEEKAYLYFTHQDGKKDSTSNLNDAEIKKLEEQLEQLKKEHNNLIVKCNLAKNGYEEAKVKLDQMLQPKKTVTKRRWECKDLAITLNKLLKKLPLVGNFIANKIYPKINERIESQKMNLDSLNQAQGEYDRAKSTYLDLIEQYNQTCDRQDIFKQLIDKKRKSANLDNTIKNMENNLSAQRVEIFKMYNNACGLLHLPKLDDINQFDSNHINDILQKLKGQQDENLQSLLKELNLGLANYNQGVKERKNSIKEKNGNNDFIRKNLSKLGLPLNISVDDLSSRYKKLKAARTEQETHMKEVEKQWINADEILTEALSNIKGKNYHLVEYVEKVEAKEKSSDGKDPGEKDVERILLRPVKETGGEKAEEKSLDGDDPSKDDEKAKGKSPDDNDPSEKDVERILLRPVKETGGDKAKEKSSDGNDPSKDDDEKAKGKSSDGKDSSEKDVERILLRPIKETGGEKAEEKSPDGNDPSKDDDEKAKGKSPDGNNPDKDSIHDPLAEKIAGPRSALHAAAKMLSGQISLSFQRKPTETDSKKFVDSLSDEQLLGIAGSSSTVPSDPSDKNKSK